MIKIQPIKNFLGFGDGIRKGEYFYSQGMQRSREGIKPYWAIIESINSGTLANLSLIKWFDQRKETTGIFTYGVDKNGKIYKVQQGYNDWELAREPATTNKGNGLIVDQKNRLLYLQTRYLGIYPDPVGATWDDEWQDFGADISPDDEWRPADLYEEWVVMGNGNKIALLNTTDDSFNPDAFNLPEGFVIKAIKSGKNGVLIGANFGNRGILVLWDCLAERSIAPWIWVEGNIYSIAKYYGNWIVSTGKEIFITNGYTQKHLTMPIDSKIQDVSFGPNYPSGMLVKDFYLFLNGGYWVERNRRKTGLWIYDLITNLWEFCPISNYCLANISLGALFIDNAWNFYTSYETSIPDEKYIGQIWNGPPSKSFYISPPMGKGDNQKIAEGLILNLAFDLDYYLVYTPDWQITVGIYDFKKPLWRYGQTVSASSQVNQLKVNGTIAVYNEAEVGDMVMVLEGANAGEIRFITTISGKDTANEIWTLDSNLPNLTESSVMLNVLAIRKIGVWTINSYPIKEHYFPIKHSPQSKKFMVMVYLKGSKLVPELSGLSLIYDDLGIL